MKYIINESYIFAYLKFFMSINIGINGFGRIGRVIARILATKKKFKVVLINEIDEDVNNLAYLFKYDSHYGKFSGSISADKKIIKIEIDPSKRIADVNHLDNSVVID